MVETTLTSESSLCTASRSCLFFISFGVSCDSKGRIGCFSVNLTLHERLCKTSDASPKILLTLSSVRSMLLWYLTVNSWVFFALVGSAHTINRARHTNPIMFCVLPPQSHFPS